MQMTISQAADLLKVSNQTIRRRLLNGLLKGEKIPTPQGHRWIVEVPDTQDTTAPEGGTSELVDILRSQLEHKDQQISELHRLLAQAALPPALTKAWWQFWK